MVIGVDFDNTIVCYDPLFHRLAREQGLIPKELPVSKGKVRDYLRRTGKENVWTEMQGYVYGSRMEEVQPFPGVLDFFLACKQRNVPVYIISHKTLHPFEGQKYNLHETAHQWLKKNGFYEPEKIGLTKAHVFFDLTKQEKLDRIEELACTHFIDDLPEFLLEKTFPKNIMRILFDPNSIYSSYTQLDRLESWSEIYNKIFPTHKDVPHFL